MQILELISTALSPDILVPVFICTLYGAIVGAMPGLSASMAVALLVPFTYFMDPAQACAAIVATTTAAVFAGDIASTLLRIPGTPASAAYVDDCYGLTLAGKARTALFISLFASAIGGVIGVAGLSFATPVLARFAASFSSVETFWLACLGLTCAVFVGGASVSRNFASLFIGLAIACIGIDVVAGHARYTMGFVDLLDGVSFIPAMIGLFAVTELFKAARTSNTGTEVRITLEPMGQAAMNALREIGRRKLNVARSGLIGTLIGVVPGAGADVAAWVTYGISRRLSKTPEKYGNGHPEGIVDASTANNASVAGSWTPAVIFGIPGDSVTAIAIGVLLMKGLTPGPQIFSGDTGMIYTIYGSFAAANLVMIVTGALAIYVASSILRVPQAILMSTVMLLSLVGAYAVVQSPAALWIVIVLGILGYMMMRARIPLAPAILGIVLGRVIEDNFMISMLKAQGNLGYFFSREVAAVLGTVTVGLWAILLLQPVLRKLAEQRRAKVSSIAS